MMDLLYLVVGIVVGTLISYLFLKMRSKDDLNNSASLTMSVEREKAVLLQQVDDLRSQVIKAEQLSQTLQNELKELNASKVKAETVAQALETRLTEHKNELETIRVQMKEQFSAIASDIVLKNSQRIQEDHKTKLDDILNPLKDKIEKFETQVRTSHEERIKENQSLKEQLIQLQTMNKSIGDEARNLVSALKGQAKTQGNWGEMILEKILERSGLVKGREYFVQTSLQSDDGKRFQPDVIISLPEGRSIVVDAKVSLIAYERYANEEDDVAKALALREHLSSVRKHIKDLSAKNYQSLHGINTLDFVLLFIPVEPAFALAIEQDHELFNEAFEKNIVLVTTSTLLATLRTIASIWRLEYQNKNAVEIARQSGDLYDKFSALIEDMISIGKKMKDAQSAYEGTMNKLHTGNGNLISRVERLKKLGVKTTKQINQTLIDRTEDIQELEEGNEDVSANMQSK